MADMADFDRGRRKRGRQRGGRSKYDGGRGFYSYEDEDEEPQQPQMTRPIILAKPDRPLSESAGSPPGDAASIEAVGQRTRGDDTFTSNNIPSMLAGDSIPPQVYLVQRPPPSSGASESIPAASRHEGTTQNSSAAPPHVSKPIKLVDENFTWSDQAMEMLLDQTDFVVIGVLGLQGSGKSTIMSILAGCKPHQLKKYPFRAQTPANRDASRHQTIGIDMYVTPERIILLDTQPLLSASVLDQLMVHEKKCPTEDNCVEMQSLQMATFLFTVCNAVIVTMDWFADLTLLKMLRTAEMLKPATPSGSSGEGAEDVSEDYFPQLVFVLNAANRADFTAENYNAMQSYLKMVMAKSSLKMDSGIHMATGTIVQGLSEKTVKDPLNLIVLPQIEDTSDQGVFSPMTDFKGHPGFENIAQAFRNRLVAMPRYPLTHTTLSEKNWFHYAARTWEGVKKSPMLAEYNRLLT